MTQQTMMGFLKKKKTDSNKVLKTPAVTNLESSLVTNVQSLKAMNMESSIVMNVESTVRNVESPMDTNEESPMVMSEESPMVTNVDVQLSSTSTAPIPAETVPTESKSTHPVLSQEQCEASIKEFFTEDKVHNYYTCFNQCSKATEQELQRIKPKNLNHDWVEKINN